MTKITLLLIALHFVSDQMIQPRFIKENKHKSSLLMVGHALVWSIPFLWMSIIFMYTQQNFSWLGWWAIITFLHFAIEWPINRASTYEWYARKLKKYTLWSQFETILTLLMVLSTFYYFS